MDQFTFTDKTKKLTYILMAIGILGLGYGFMDSDVDGQRIWSNVLINGIFFFGIALGATFFMAVQSAAESAWPTVLKRIFEGIGAYMPVGAAILVVVWLVASFHGNHLYHWMDADAAAHDPILQKKSAYLNLPFFWIRTIAYLGVWIWYMMIMRKRSIEEDAIGGTDFIYQNQRYSAIFLVFFAVSSSTSAWDWIMSIDVHWFSTLFGWYIFSGYWISALTTITLVTLFLKSQGYLKEVNTSHIHDLGKWMFGVSILWTYLWFSQFMLIWYANIPEEVTYFFSRINDYPWLYFGMIAMNLLLPLIILMDADNKKRAGVLTFVGVCIFFFHWVDVYMLVTPAVLKGGGSIGITEIGMFLGFLGLFIYVVLNALTKAPLVVKNHPYLDESIHFHQH